jgi:hypothetical protein
MSIDVLKSAYIVLHKKCSSVFSSNELRYSFEEESRKSYVSLWPPTGIFHSQKHTWQLEGRKVRHSYYILFCIAI